MRGYTQQELARACGLSQSAIGSYETGQRQSSRSVRRLALVLGVSLDWLEMGRSPMEGASLLMEPPPGEPAPSAWPFRGITPQQLAALSGRDLRLLENMMRSFIETCQTEPIVAPRSTHSRRAR